MAQWCLTCREFRLFMKYTLRRMYEVLLDWYLLESSLRSPYLSAVAFHNFLNISPPLPTCSGTSFDLLVLQAICLLIVIYAIVHMESQ